jgi:hypothetical protein
MSEPLKTVKMDPKAHKIIKEYTMKKGFKFAKFIENVCVEYIKNEEAKKK